MKTKKIKDLDLEVYFEKLNNGLEVYIIPSNNVNNTYVTYSAKYGGMHNEFYVNDEKVTVPMGIAHFLEHKMFETEDGIDVFNFFQERGSNCNANTNSKKTTYLFSGPNAFYENLEYLLSYVESPYFTDENVNKEKGIIEQEIMMYKDNPYSRMYEDLMYNLFVNHPLKYPTIGTKESINKITKEDLYTCYNAFYHPSNMFVVVTGNVDSKKTMDLIKKHEDKRKIDKINVRKIECLDETNLVALDNEVLKMDVTIPKVAISYKIDISNIDYLDINKIYSYLINVVDLKVGPTSLFTEKLRLENLITDTFDVTCIKANKHIILIVDTETDHPDEVLERLKEEMKDLTVTFKEFERRKKTGISSLHFMSDNIYKINSKIVNDIMEYDDVDYDPISTIKSYDYNKALKLIKDINLDNYSVIKIMPEN